MASFKGGVTAFSNYLNSLESLLQVFFFYLIMQRINYSLGKAKKSFKSHLEIIKLLYVYKI